jgi:hypothetical protein
VSVKRIETMGRPTRMMVHQAVQDILNRTLGGISDDFGRLICLASTRDYNTGRYHHEGLASRFSDEVAESALAACHLEIFRQLSLSSLEDLVRQLESYLASTGASPTEVVEAWEKLQPYRVTIPLECDPLSAEVFFSNIRIALAILRRRRRNVAQGPRSSSQQPLPAQ